MRDKSLIITISILIFGLWTFCTNKKKEQTQTQRITLEIDSIISNDPFYLSDVFSNFKIIILETNEESIINRIDNLQLINDTLYIFDRSVKSLLIFSVDGKFIRKVDKSGRGPDEYLEPIDFDIDLSQRQIFILDWGLKKINMYSSHGDFKGKIDIRNRFSSFILSGKDILLYMPLPEVRNSSDYKLIHCLTYKGNRNWEKMNASDFLRGPKMVYSNQGGNFYRSKEDVKFFMNFSNTIYSITKRSVQPYIELQSQKFCLDMKDLKSINEDNFSFFELGGLNKLTNIYSYSDNDNLAFFYFEIGLTQYLTFYYFNTGKIICSARYIDDLTFCYPNLFKINDNRMIAYLNPFTKLSRLKELISTRKIIVSDDEKDKVMRCTESNNPIILLFDIKEN